MEIDLDELSRLIEKLQGSKSTVSRETLKALDEVCTKQAIQIEQLKARIKELEPPKYTPHGGTGFESLP